MENQNTSLILYNKIKQTNMNINNYLKVFSNFLSYIKDENVVFAGTYALKIHGLKISRKPNDLDVVIFNPTEKQLIFLRNVSSLFSSKYDASGNIDIQDENYPIDNMILKFMKDDLCLDIILQQSEVPEQLLFHKYNNDYWKIQNIALNIEAKNSYAVRNSDGLRSYRRVKDLIDFQDLKNSNFNIN